MALTPAEGSLIFFVLYSVLVTAVLIALIILCRKKQKSLRDQQRQLRRTPNRLPNQSLPYQENKSFEDDNPVIFVPGSNQITPRATHQTESDHPGVSIIEYEVQRQRQRSISRGEESLASFKSVVDSHIGDFASLRSDSFHTIYDEVTLTSGSPKNSKMYKETEFLNTLIDNSHGRMKKKAAPNPPPLSKAKISRIQVSDEFRYDVSSKPLDLKAYSLDRDVKELGFLGKNESLRNANHSDKDTSDKHLNPPRKYRSSSSSDINSSDEEQTTVLNKRNDSQTSDITVRLTENIPQKISVVATDSSDDESFLPDQKELDQIDILNPRATSDNIQDIHQNTHSSHQSSSSDSEFSVTDKKIVSSTLRDKGSPFHENLQESNIHHTYIDLDHLSYDEHSSIKMCQPMPEDYSSSTTSSEQGGHSSDTDVITSKAHLSKDMSMTSEISTYSIQFKRNPNEHIASSNTDLYPRKNTNSSSSSSSDNATETTNMDTSRDITSFINEIHQVRGIDNHSWSKDAIQSYEKYDSSEQYTRVSVSLENNDAIDIHQDDTQPTQPNKQSPINDAAKNTSSSSSSSSSSEVGESIPSIKFVPLGKYLSSNSSLKPPSQEIDTISTTSSRLRNGQESPKYIPFSEIKKEMGSYKGGSLAQVMERLETDSLSGNRDALTPKNNPQKIKDKASSSSSSSHSSCTKEEKSTKEGPLSKVSKNDSSIWKSHSQFQRLSAPKTLVDTDDSSDEGDENLSAFLKLSTIQLRKKSPLVEWDSGITEEQLAPQLPRTISLEEEDSSSSSSSSFSSSSNDQDESHGQCMKISESSRHFIHETIQELSAEEYSDGLDGTDRSSSIKTCIRVSDPSSSSSESEVIHSPPDPMRVLKNPRLKRTKSLDSLSSSGSNKSNSINVHPLVDLVSSSTLPPTSRSNNNNNTNINISGPQDFTAKYPAFYSLNRNYRAVYSSMSIKKEQRSISTESL